MESLHLCMFIYMVYIDVKCYSIEAYNIMTILTAISYALNTYSWAIRIHKVLHWTLYGERFTSLLTVQHTHNAVQRAVTAVISTLWKMQAVIQAPPRRVELFWTNSKNVVDHHVDSTDFCQVAHRLRRRIAFSNCWGKQSLRRKTTGHKQN